ncbi:hypothetical protein IPL85_00675 [Candidatus Saccharibacteria bacterium]|nr:MAG: hypothetical protein IPL85_00675 [Candidatus Saccharibacteria bacterium]
MATNQGDGQGEAAEHSSAQGVTTQATYGHMFVKVYAPYKVYFEGQAISISAQNQTGPFDILPHHHSFITLLVPCDIVVRTDKDEEKIRIQNGIMHVKSDSVVVFLDV